MREQNTYGGRKIASIRRPLLAVSIVLATLLLPATVTQSAAGCGLPSPAFCDTFDAPSPLGAGTRSGDLDGVVWGVSRATQNDNPSQGGLQEWQTTHRTQCGTQAAAPERDVVICNGQLVESVTDGEAVTVLAMYPRQPFDFAGRTGKIVFDVGDDTQGPHAAWPAFAITDQPVPAPYQDAAGLANYARNSFGFSLALVCAGGGVGVDTMYTTTSYAFQARGFTQQGCVQHGTAASLNHFEVRLSPTSVQVLGTDPGSSTLKPLAQANFAMPLTRGLPWIEDVHYNADKFNNQGTHTFVWDNFGFDGPYTYRDLGFDVLDATHNGTSGGNLGWLMPGGGGLSLQIPGVNSIANATGAWLVFSWTPHSKATITYALNGHVAHTQAWPYGNAALFRAMTLAVPVPLTELQAGTNSLNIRSTDTDLGGASIANIDLILVAAGGPSPTPSSTATPPPTATPTGTPSPTDTPVPTSTPAPTETPTCAVRVVDGGVDRVVIQPTRILCDGGP